MGTLVLPTEGGGTLVIEKNLSIRAPSGRRVTIRRDPTDPEFRIMQIAPGVIVTLTNLVIRGGRVVDEFETVENGGGIYNNGSALTLRNALLAPNQARNGPDIFSPTPPVASFSLIGKGEDSGLEGQDGQNGNQVGTTSDPINPRIEPLENNGGPTKTHALRLGSPAINRGTLNGCPARDQRGVRRPQGRTCDIGSFERRQ